MNKAKSDKKELSAKQREELLKALKTRFEKNLNRHKGLDWAKVQARLEANPDKLWSLRKWNAPAANRMWWVRIKNRANSFSSIVPSKRRQAASVFATTMKRWIRGRSTNPKAAPWSMAAAMGIELLTEEEYFALQKLGEFDTKRSSWIKTPPEIRKLGGALYGDRRYKRNFTGHNGAESYYSGRGFRGSLRV